VRLSADIEEADIYYYKRSGILPIGNLGPKANGKLIASRKRLARHTDRLAASRED
jgi:hypothetical protein